MPLFRNLLVVAILSIASACGRSPAVVFDPNYDAQQARKVLVTVLDA
ncbi:MAG: hypothetical protein AB7O59_00495 [Pirellulales bacterium]